MGAYTGDNYHLSATYTTQQKGYTGGYPYFSTYMAGAGNKKAVGTPGSLGQTGIDNDGWALRGWWRPDETGTAVPSVSVGYDTVSFNTTAAGKFKEGEGYSVALNWSDIFQADDTIGLAFGQPIKGKNNVTPGVEDVDPFIWEAYYSFRPNDSIEITPGIFGGTDAYKTKEDDVFGAVLTTVFRF